ncbi:MAG TPA: response regulator, partial [Polyangiaceae bacterium]
MRILLLEDSERIVSVVTRALTQAGHSIKSVATCRDATELLNDQAFELAIIDLGIPDGSGLDVCRAARRAELDLPILILTARNQVCDRVDGLDAGADDYL